MFRTKLVFIFLIFLTLNIKAQELMDYENPKDFIIADIQISGVKFLSMDALVKLSGLAVGQKVTIPGDAITEAINKLWKQNLFSDVKIAITKVEDDNVYLIIHLQERPRLYNIEYRGVRKSEKEDLEEATKLVPGQSVTQNLINNTKNIIKKHFAEKGYFKTDVNIIVKPDTTLQNVVNMVINVDKRKKIKINEIIVDGNQVFTIRKIRRNLKETKQKRWYGFFKPSKYIADKFEEDKKNLISKYNSKGYRDAIILEDSIWDYDERTINLYLKINEGPQYFFRSINWVGNTKFSSEQLSKVLDIKPGDVYDQERLEKRLVTDQNAVGNLYLDDGYLFYQSIPREVQIVNDSIDLEILIYEGKQASIDKIIIAGNTRTNDYVIRREIRTLPGELFSKSDIIRTIRELAQLGNFDPEKLSPVPVPNQEKGTVDIEYNVVEKPNDMVELSGSWGRGMFLGALGVRFNNFSMKNIFDKDSWAPLPSGDGQQLSLRFTSNGNRYQLYSISFTEPWLGGKKPTSLSVSFYHNLISNGYKKGDSRRGDIKIYGVSAGIGKRLKWPDDYFTFYQEISYQNYIINKYNYFSFIDSGHSNILSAKTVFGRNSVDNPLYSRRGSSFSVSLQFTPPYSLFNNKDYTTISKNEKYKWVEYYKWSFDATWYNQIVGDLVLKLNAQYGILGYYNRDIGPSPFEEYVVGGSGMVYYSYGKDIVSLRGYEDEKITPPTGGFLYDKYTMELRYPVTLSESATIYGLGFLEGGNCWTKFNEFKPFNMYRSAGFGVRVFLPMLGMIGIDWGYGFDEIPHATDSNKSQFHFTIGQQF